MLPLLSPRWLLIAAPIFLQHLLSWRSSEWTIYFHYAAPLLPVLWVALAEGVAAIYRRPATPVILRRVLPLLVLAACVGGQLFLGPVGGVIASIENWRRTEGERKRRAEFIHQIPPGASVVAPLPYLSHLALRERLFSLHYILKGLKTLSRSPYEPPPPTEFVLIDYGDSATFDPDAGYYHPTMKTVAGGVVPSSERLLHDFLRPRSWSVTSTNELTLLRREESTGSGGPEEPRSDQDPSATLLACAKSGDILSDGGFEITTSWKFRMPREVFPWLFLKLTPRAPGNPVVLSRGLCSPESRDPLTTETWRITPSPRIPPGQYMAEALFVDNSKRLWLERSGTSQSVLLTPAPIPLGELTVRGSAPTAP